MAVGSGQWAVLFSVIHFFVYQLLTWFFVARACALRRLAYGYGLNEYCQLSTANCQLSTSSLDLTFYLPLLSGWNGLTEGWRQTI